MSIIREVKESPLAQGSDERIAYQLTTTPWGSSPSSVVVKLYTWPDKTDVSSTKLSGATSAVGDIITTPLVIALVAGTKYHLEIQWVSSGNTFEAFAEINGE